MQDHYLSIEDKTALSGKCEKKSPGGQVTYHLYVDNRIDETYEAPRRR
jgi:hypothetical protein